MEELGNEFNKKPKVKKGLIITLAIIAVLIIALCLVYFLVLSKPNYIFNKGIDKIFGEKSQEYNTAIVDFKLKASLDSDNKQIAEVNDILKDCQIDFKTQLDKTNKKEIVDLGLNYKDENAISAQVYYNNGEEYILLQELFDKYIKLNMTEEQKKQIEEVFESLVNQQKNADQIKEILKEELKKAIKEQGEFSKDSETIEIAGKDVKVAKNTLVMNQKQVFKAIQTICTDLSKNDKFIECFEESPKDSLKKIADNIKEKLDDEDYNTKTKFEMSILTKGILKNFAGIKATTIDADEDTEVECEVVKEDKETYSIMVKSDDTNSQTLKGTVKVEKTVKEKEKSEGKINVSLDIPNAGTVKLDVEYKIALNGKIDELNVKNAIDMEKLTDEDKKDILDKLYERPLIGDALENMLTSSLFGTTSSAKNKLQNQLEEEQNLMDNYSSKELTTKQNEIYDGDYRVEYSVPEGFEFDTEWSSDSYKYYTQGDYDKGIEVQAEIDYFGVTSSIESEYESTNEYYDNTKLGEEKTIELNGKTFKYQTISYESYGIKKQKTYVWYELDEDYSFLLNFDATDTDVTEDVIKGFLNITVSK